MSPEASRTAANVVLALAAGAAVYVVLKTPALRRTVWQALRTQLTVTLPGYVMHELQEAWSASPQRS